MTLRVDASVISQLVKLVRLLRHGAGSAFSEWVEEYVGQGLEAQFILRAESKVGLVRQFVIRPVGFEKPVPNCEYRAEIAVLINGVCRVMEAVQIRRYHKD